MVMEFEGKKATHDFLSLYDRDSSLQLQDPLPPSNSYSLKTQDFLKPLEKTEEPAQQSAGPTAVAHVLPGGIGTYSIRHVPDCDSPADVKPEVFGCVSGSGLGGKAEPDGGVFGPVGFGLWNPPAASNGKEGGFRGQWPLPFAARSTTSFTSIDPCAHDKNTLMDSVLKTSGVFGDENKEEVLFGKIESVSRPELINARVDRKGGNEQKPTTPRSKHSATEQRRRSKINDRFQMLREIIPNSDQKRDKASFLLEVIEYVRFLQEKVEKYEPSCSGWMEETKKLTPWTSNHVPIVAVANHSEVRANDHASGSMYSSENKTNHIEADINENHVALSKKATSAPISLQLNQTSIERGTSVTQQRSISEIDNMASESHGQWLKPNDYSGSSNMLNTEHEDLVIDEGTISVSTAYSQNLLNTLNQALESSGIDMSQANLSVNIHLGKRAAKGTIATILSSSKNSKDCEQALKRRCHSPDK